MKIKKGASHVEVILSFVLFTSFIIFIFIVFKPLDVFSKTTSDLNMIENEILKNISGNLSVVSMKIDSSATGACFSVDDPLDGLLPLIVKNESGKVVNASRSGEKVYFENSGDFYRLYYSDELIETGLSGTCFELTDTDYATGFVKLRAVVPYSKLVDFKTRHNNNYEQLKQELGLENDFIVTLKNSAEIIFEVQKQKPAGIEIMAKDVPISILDEDADLKFDLMNIQVWG